MKNMTKIIAFSAIASLMVIGCGGGGSVGSKLNFDNAAEAPANKETGKGVTDSLVNQLGANGNLGNLNGLERKTNLERKARDVALELAKKAKHVNRNENCASGGYVNINGDVDETGGTVTEDFHSCKLDGATINGKVKVNLKFDDGDFAYAKLNFLNDLTVKAPGRSETIYKGSTIEYKKNSDEGMDIVSTMKLKANGKIYGQKGAKWHYFGLYGEVSASQIEGKIYFNNATEYVTYDKSYDMKNTPIEFSAKHLFSGEAHYITKNKGKIILKVIDEDIVEISIDKNGNGTIDDTVTYNLNK